MNGQRLRPLGLGDIFDEGFDLYKRNFVFLLLVTALTVVPLDILLAWLRPRLLPPIFDLFSVTAAQSDQFLAGFVTALVKLTLFLPLYALAVAPLVSASSTCYLDAESTLWGAYRIFFRRFPRLFLTVLLGGIALAVSLLGCGVLWLAVACQFFLTLQVLLVEQPSAVKALGRSGTLVSGYGGRVLGCLLLLSLITWVIGLGLRWPLGYLFDILLNLTPAAGALYGAGAPGGGQNAVQEAVALLGNGLSDLLLIPFQISVMTVLYFDLRVRKEGFDVELLAQDLNYPPLTALGPFLPHATVFRPVQPGYPSPPQRRGQGGPSSGGPSR